jgi:hypothetical protein
MFAVLGVTGNLDGDNVLGDVLTPVGAERGTEDPGADEGAQLFVLAPARQLPLGEQPLVLRGLLGTDVDNDDVQLTHDGASSVALAPILVASPVGGQSVPDSTPPLARTHEIRRSVLEQSLRYGPFKAHRTAFSVALAIFWRMRGEVQQPRNGGACSRQK